MGRRLHFELTGFDFHRNNARGTKISKPCGLQQSVSQARKKLASATMWKIHRAEYATIQIDVLLGQECHCVCPWTRLFLSATQV
jgi:hypothetical protein